MPIPDMKITTCLSRHIEEAHSKQEVAFSELYTPQFMQRHTRVETFDALLKAGGYDVNGPEDFEAIPDKEWDNHIRAYTDFASWRETIETAAREWMGRRLGL